jgi:hypothetical protein
MMDYGFMCINSVEMLRLCLVILRSNLHFLVCLRGKKS